MSDLNFNNNPSEFKQKVREISTTDAVLGGEQGPVNVAMSDLAERDAYLHQQQLEQQSAQDSHQNNTANPHQVSKAQIGLGNLPNATSAAVNLDSNNTLATSRAAKTAYDQATSAANANQAHANNHNNPHQVSKAQVGLGNLPNSVSSATTSTSTNTLATSRAVNNLRQQLIETINGTNATVAALDNEVSTKLNQPQADARYLRLSQLNNSVGVNSTTSAATSQAVMRAYDLANQALAAANQPFPSGTRMLFMQANAPVGWTRVTSHNNKMLRIVSGTGGGSGGSVSFTNTFRNRTITGSTANSIVTGVVSVNNHTLSLAQMPSHRHLHGSMTIQAEPHVGGGIFSAGYHNVHNTSAQGGSQPHAHTASMTTNAHGHTFSTSLNLSTQYVDAIICQKN